MRRLQRFLFPLVLAGAAAAGASGIAGCAAHSGYVIDEVPPAREEVVIYRPGYIWIHGHWTRAPGHRWAWRGGFYERERPTHVYVQGRWEHRGGQYVWIEGQWRPRGRVVVR